MAPPRSAGDHAITASGGTAANYNVAFVSGNLHVDKATGLTVTADAKSKVYGAAEIGRRPRHHRLGGHGGQLQRRLRQRQPARRQGHRPDRDRRRQEQGLWRRRDRPATTPSPPRGARRPTTTSPSSAATCTSTRPPA